MDSYTAVGFYTYLRSFLILSDLHYIQELLYRYRYYKLIWIPYHACYSSRYRSSYPILIDLIALVLTGLLLVPQNRERAPRDPCPSIGPPHKHRPSGMIPVTRR